MKVKKVKRVGPLKDLYRQSVCLANQIAADIYIAADTQRSREMLSLLTSGNYSEIVSASIVPTDYTSADTFGRDYLCVELMSKFPKWDIGVDRADVARSKFFEVEEYLSKLKFRENPRLVVGKKSTTLAAVISTAAIKVSKILGELDLNEIHSFFAFGPGASTSLPKRRGDAAYKFGAQRPHLTYNAMFLADALARAHPTWSFQAEVVHGSKLVTVPKNAKTDRTICIEPDLNMYFQKGIGRVIRHRLNRWGLLKPDAQQYNAELAREGSANGRLATVDLSSASDSIHLHLLDLLLPMDWRGLIEQTRSPQVVLPSGKLHLLTKVSSMGNGYTFELETLIFYSVARSLIDLLASGSMDHRCTVFGDDIIIASELVPVLEEVLHCLGFTLNRKKTFNSGPFRESCGKHYFNGTDVTPFYIREPVDTVLRKYWAANTVRRYSRMAWGLDGRWQPVYDRIVSTISPKFQGYKIPEGRGDGGLIADWDEVRPSRAPDGHDAWRLKEIVPRKKDLSLGSFGTMLKVLHVMEFPRSKPFDPDRAEMKARILANIVAALQSNRDAFELPDGWTADDFNEIICNEGLETGSEVQPSKIPMPQGYRVNDKATSQRWPSFGPWLHS